jgi:hypothetical protein
MKIDGFEGVKLPLLFASTVGVGLPSVLLIPSYAARKPGLYRMILFLPVILMHLALPLVFSCDTEVVERASALFLFSWLANFRIIGLCLNRGPLTFQSWTPLQTLLVLYLPIFPRPPSQSQKKAGRLQDSSGTSTSLLIQWISKIALLSVVVLLLNDKRSNQDFKNLLYPWALYSFLGLLMDGPAAFFLSLVNIQILPTFDRPWLSSSLSDFWGRRWNITTSHTLRVIVYDPIAEGVLIKAEGDKHEKTLKKEDRTYGRLAGLLATFIASGIIHESIFVVLQSTGPLVCLKWLAFFSIQGPLMMFEWYLHKVAVKAGWQPRTLISRVVTISLLMLLAHLWFYPPCTVDSDLAERVVREVMSCLDRVLAWLYIR